MAVWEKYMILYLSINNIVDTYNIGMLIFIVGDSKVEKCLSIKTKARTFSLFI